MSDNGDSDSSADDETYTPPVEEEASNEEEDETKEKTVDNISKKDVDDLWDNFKADIKKDTTDDTKKVVENGKSVVKNDTSSDQTEMKNTVTVTEVYDFAGEEVTIKKEVGKNSKEAQKHLKISSTVSPGIRIPGGPLGKMKRPGGLQGVLGKMGKKPKLSTLEKSKLDWQNYKEETGIHEELKSHNKGKDGYIEKQMFLERTDYRQFEKERDLRLSRQKK